MATFKRCDICGKEYNSGFLIQIDTFGIGFITFSDLIDLKTIDLCKDCFQKFKKKADEIKESCKNEL